MTLFENRTVVYDFSGGMESAAMLVIDRERIERLGAVVRWANTGKQFPEMAASIAQVESILGLKVVEVSRRITFDEFLFERGGMLRKGTTDCSRRMKRHNLSRHLRQFAQPWEVNLGFNSEEDDRAESFSARNERDFCHWRYPLIEAGIDRDESAVICQRAGFTVLVGMYEKMGRFDCWLCPNQKPSQVRLVAKHYPELMAEWKNIETRKGHSILPRPLEMILADAADDGSPTGCSCFGGEEDVFEDEEPKQPATLPVASQ